MKICRLTVFMRKKNSDRNAMFYIRGSPEAPSG